MRFSAAHWWMDSRTTNLQVNGHDTVFGTHRVWAGLAISTRVTDTRVAQQLSILGSLPPVALAALMSFQVISPTFGLAAALAGGLLAVDCAACLAVARLFDRERLITGARPSGGIPAPAAPHDIRSPGQVGSHQ